MTQRPPIECMYRNMEYVFAVTLFIQTTTSARAQDDAIDTQPIDALVDKLLESCEVQTSRRSLNNVIDNANIRTRIETLNGDSTAYRLAAAVASHGLPATPYLVLNLQSANPKVRSVSAFALGIMDYATNASFHQSVCALAGKPLVHALQMESDERSAWHIIRAIAKLTPDPDIALPALVGVLSTDSHALHWQAIRAIESYQQQAGSCKHDLIAFLKTCNDAMLASQVTSLILQLGIDVNDVAAMEGLRLSQSPNIAAHVICELFGHPSLALSLLKSHPGVFREMEMGPSIYKLLELLDDSSDHKRALREHIRVRDDLPSVAMAWTGDDRFRAIITSRVEVASPYDRKILCACLRALGEKPDSELSISQTLPGVFKPRSASLLGDRSRRTDLGNHYDGVVFVLITGRILQSDGTPLVNPRLFRLNDSMLLGRSIDAPLNTFKYDKESGRFVLLTTVFGAFCNPDGNAIGGPYQTGCAEVRIEGDGVFPMTVRFYDEMPDVTIRFTTSSP